MGFGGMFLGGCGGMLTFLHTLTKTSQHGHPSLAHKVLVGFGGVNVPAHTHTCSEQSLRILMWNASRVQK